MKFNKAFWIIAVPVLIAGAGFLAVRLLSRNEPIPLARSAVVTRRDIGAKVVATGIIKPMVGAEVKVGSRVSGVVKKLRAHIGDTVEKGRVIAELDDLELKAKLNQNQAALEKSKADHEYAEANLIRLRALLARNFISRQQIDLAENALKVARAQVDQAEANVAFARIQLDYARITAPVSGVIASISTQEGETVAASLASPTFVNIIDLHRLEVQAYIDETDIGRIVPGLEAGFTVDTFPDTDFRGRITAIYPKAVIQDNVVNYIVTLEITDFQEKMLRPEMTANVTIVLETRRGVLAVPTSAIGRNAGRRFVDVLIDGRPSRRAVRTGWKDEGFTEIIDGLREGETCLIIS